jgi:hypothetical protein
MQIDHIRLSWMNGNISASSILIDVQDFFPGFACINVDLYRSSVNLDDLNNGPGAAYIQYFFIRWI